MKFILADIEIPMGALTGWLPGLLAFLFIVALLLTIWNAGKKAFGRRPPIDDEMDSREKKLRSEIYHAKNAVRKELNERLFKAEQAIEDIRLDRERKWKELTTEYQGIEVKLATLTERISNAIKKLEDK